jgi:hypothetical protein
MALSDKLGIFGVGLILLAYFLNVANKLGSGNKLYLTMNMLGAGIACYASWLISYIPFVILEGVWAAVSVIALVKRLK